MLPPSTTLPSYIQDYAGTGRVIILLHGFLSSKSYWKKLTPFLTSEGYRIITIDLLGFGNAPKPKHLIYNYDDHLNHIQSILKVLEITQPVTFIGHSMGALLALRYAQKYPEAVTDMCLLNPPMYTHPEQARSTLRDTGLFYRLLLDSRYRHILWILLRKIGPFASHTKYSREGSLENIIATASFFIDLEATTHKTLLLIGTKDRRIYFENIKQKTLHNNINVVIETSGHHTAITHTKQLARHIHTFLSRV